MEKSAILYHASRVVLSTFDLDEVLRQILTIVRDQFAISNGAIFLLDDESQELYIKQHVGRIAESITKIPYGKGLTGHAAASKQLVYAPDVSADPRYIKGCADTRSELAIPLIIRDEVIGLLDLQSNELDAFDAETTRLLTLFSLQASVGIENARLYSLEKMRATQLEAINAIARQTTAELELEQLLPQVEGLVLTHFHVSHVAVLLHREHQLELRSHAGTLKPGATDLPDTDDARLLSKCFSSGEALLENDVRSGLGLEPYFKGSAAELSLPLTFSSEPLGVLALASDRPRFFDPSVLEPLTAVADILSGAIKNCLLLENARQLAYRDGLTGMFNRRFFEERILEEIDRCSRYQTGIALLMVDIDHFKAINDDFGHMLGDEVLRQVSQLFLQQLRKSDIVCRFGGEEFAIILPQTDGVSSVEAAEKLRRIVRSAPFPGINRPITVSVGVAHFPANGTSRDTIIGAADSALYTAKQSGRNRVVLAPAEAFSAPTTAR